jgi:3-hydroxyacyl-CoA dehydrogenase
MSEMVKVGKQGDVMVITIDNPPVNALSPGVPEGIASAIERLNADAEVRAAVLIGAGKTFVAGADIKEFAKMTSGKKERGPGLLPFLLKIEDSKKPVIVAIHGQALGGGLELAMAGHYRVAAAAAQVGQPEVKLGIIPGAAGTQRLPRLAGVAAALEMCTEGKPIPAATALSLGIVDKIVDVTGGDLLEGAVAFAREVAASGKTAFPKTRARNEKLGALRDNELLFENARAGVRKKQRGLKAPLAAIDAIEAATREPFETGCATEQRLFTECLHSEQSKALIHIFFAEREVAKIPDVPKDTATIPVKSAVVIGAGTMGGGIAMVLANAGIPVTLKETEQAALDRGLATIGKNYASSVKRGRMTQPAVDERMKLIGSTVAWDAVAGADLVIEAVFENMALKKEIFAQLDALAKPGAILASNTSTLSIDEIASATKRPESVIGLHFFSPANVMKLLEVVRGRATSKEVIATCMQLGKKIGKVSVLVGNCRGFVGNRMFQPYRREAQFLVEEGAEIAAVDKALYDFGMAMGPLSTADLAGLDIGWRIRKEYKHLDKPGVRKPFAEDRMCEMGRFGQKTGAGWYKYDENRVQTADPLVKELIAQWTAEFGVPQRAIGAEEIVDRCIYALVNEGAKILEEGFALRAGDIDIIYVNGYGFPAHRGGPMWYADTVGLKKVLARVEEFEKQHGELWTPAPLLKRLAEEGKTFAEFGAAPAV